MSIDTLLEAARYLEWQSQQQQITREEEQQREKALLSREAEQKLSAPVIQTVQLNHVTWAEDMRLGSHLGSHQHHPPVPPPPLPPPVPIAVIPIPMVPANPAGLPIQTASSLHTVSPMPVVTSLATALSPQAAAPLFSPNGKDAHSPPPPLPPLPQQQRHLIAHVKTETNSLSPSNNGAKQLQTQTLLQSYPAPIITAQHTPQQHTLLPQPALPQPQPTPAQAQAGQPPRTNGATVEDPRNLDGKRRPGGAGTREVHNKLEKNRRAHLKECFDTLKKNVPNVDEKKTSNLSVLRSALRYIQTLKRKEKEYEHEMERLAREKIATQQRLAELKNELSQCIDVIEIDRILRQTVQPEDDQASTSTASEGEDNFDQDVEDDILSSPPSSSAPKLPAPSEPRPAMPPPSILPTHISIQHKPATPPSHPQAAVITPQAIAPAPPSHIISPPQQTVITHASVSHASVIQAVNHVIPAGSKHLAHIAPSSAGQPIGHITVHPVTHLPAAIYPQSVAVSQPAMVGHITHALAHHPHAHAQVNGTPVTGQQATMVGKPTAVVAHHHTGLVGQTVLNPVTMVTVPPFPVSTLKLA
ncbi:MAX network transcriptional repressor b isoform X1 [Pimephales promelas]|uniref:MAX network transcriptional repressor b isoform X1 n=1 Tax=Pimephales promelas TaxID=90988 RepID=UPI0019558474|nr:MAX network transcriptional repressor b isoform X1 [Pimephales promelas]KAG1970058.1 max-binding protein MNT [Pimephales promelas]